MPVLPNQRHEAFARELANGHSAVEAYEMAGYRRNDGNAAVLRARPEVRARVAELQGEAAERVVVNRQWVIGRLVDNVDRAMQLQPIMSAGEQTGEYRYDGSVANKALELLGKEIGMFVERSENLNTHYVISDRQPTEEEWVAEFVIPN